MINYFLLKKKLIKNYQVNFFYKKIDYMMMMQDIGTAEKGRTLSARVLLKLL